MEYSSYPTLLSALHFDTRIAGPWKISTYLASSINDLGGVLLALVLDDLTEGVLDGGVVALYEMTVHELHRERGFTLSNVSESERERDEGKRLTDRPAADNGDLALFGWSSHVYDLSLVSWLSKGDLQVGDGEDDGMRFVGLKSLPFCEAANWTPLLTVARQWRI